MSPQDSASLFAFTFLWCLKDLVDKVFDRQFGDLFGEFGPKVTEFKIQYYLKFLNFLLKFFYFIV
jgi:hypothetical protein